MAQLNGLHRKINIFIFKKILFMVFQALCGPPRAYFISHLSSPSPCALTMVSLPVLWKKKKTQFLPILWQRKFQHTWVTSSKIPNLTPLPLSELDPHVTLLVAPLNSPWRHFPHLPSSDVSLILCFTELSSWSLQTVKQRPSCLVHHFISWA